MSTPKAQTLQQRFGFTDADLKTSAHDEIMLWLDENMEQVVRGLIKSELEFKIESKKWEFPITTQQTHGYGNRYVVGFIDMAVRTSTFNGDLSHGRVDILFEVKSTIPSLGELIRQIRMYQTYINGVYVVVSPDNRFEGPLRDQGIQFVKYVGG